MIDSSLDRIIDSMIKQRDLDPQEIQSKIDENIYFRYNSVNLVIGKRGSGKTYTTLREILKLALTGHKEYTQIHYITDKARDDTVDKFKDAFKKAQIWFNWVPVCNAEKLITALAKAKAMKQEELRGLAASEKRRKQSEEDYRALCKALSSNPIEEEEDEASHVPQMEDGLPHTIVIFDDCIGLFAKNTSLARKLFENRQARITYFLLLQDVTGLSASMKSNVDSLRLFGGFPRHKYNVLMYQMPPIDIDYEDYSQLDQHGWLEVDFIDGIPSLHGS